MERLNLFFTSCFFLFALSLEAQSAETKPASIHARILDISPLNSFVYLESNLGRNDSFKLDKNYEVTISITVNKYEKCFTLSWKNFKGGINSLFLFIDPLDQVEVINDFNKSYAAYKNGDIQTKDFLHLAGEKLGEYNHVKRALSDKDAAELSEKTIQLFDSIQKKDEIFGVVVLDMIYKDLFVDSLSFHNTLFFKNFINHIPEDAKKILPAYAKLSEIQWAGTEIISFVYLDSQFVKHQINEYFGKPIVLTLGASWCGPCREKNQELKKILSELGGKISAEIVSISLEENTKNWIQMLRDDQLPWAQGNISSKSERALVAKRFLAHQIPKTILIDAKGVVVLHEPNIKDLVSFLKGELK